MKVYTPAMQRIPGVMSSKVTDSSFRVSATYHWYDWLQVMVTNVRGRYMFALYVVCVVLGKSCNNEWRMMSSKMFQPWGLSSATTPSWLKNPTINFFFDCYMIYLSCDLRIILLDKLIVAAWKSITAHPFTSPEPPEILLAPLTPHIDPGDTIRLSCQADGTPNPEIEWLLDNRKILPQRADAHDSRDIIIEEGMLLITNAGPRDSGEYACLATNNAGRASHSIKIQVIENGE